jgi:hypothetical protein
MPICRQVSILEQNYGSEKQQGQSHGGAAEGAGSWLQRPELSRVTLAAHIPKSVKVQTGRDSTSHPIDIKYLFDMTNQNRASLSSFEIMLLRWASEGKKVVEIAMIEGRDRWEIQSLLNHVVLTLGAPSLRDTIEKAKIDNII